MVEGETEKEAVEEKEKKRKTVEEGLEGKWSEM